MKTRAGIWIDRKKAVLVFISGNTIKKKLIRSDVEKQLRRYDENNSNLPFSPMLVPADDIQQRHMEMHLNKFFDEVISNIRDAEEVLLFGPGVTKIELSKRIEKNKINGTVEDIETTDKMTDPQIIAKVKQYYFLQDHAGSQARQ
jgi:hypothetical protein